MLGAPYLASGYDGIRKVVTSDMFEEWVGKLRKASGHQVLSFNWWQGERHLWTAKPVRTPADLKGNRMRTIGSPVWLETVTAMGAVPTPMPYAEVYSALEQKVIDSVEVQLPAGYGSKLFEVTKYVTKTGHISLKKKAERRSLRARTDWRRSCRPPSRSTRQGSRELVGLIELHPGAQRYYQEQADEAAACRRGGCARPDRRIVARGRAPPTATWSPSCGCPPRARSRSSTSGTVLPRAGARDVPGHDDGFELVAISSPSERCSTTTRSRARASGGPALDAAARAARAVRADGAGRHRDRAAHARGRWPERAAVRRRRRSPSTRGGAMTSARRRPEDRGAAARGVRGRAAGAPSDGAASGVVGRARRRLGAVRDLLGLQPDPGAAVPAGVPGHRAAVDLPGLPRPRASEPGRAPRGEPVAARLVLGILALGRRLRGGRRRRGVPPGRRAHRARHRGGPGEHRARPRGTRRPSAGSCPPSVSASSPTPTWAGRIPDSLGIAHKGYGVDRIVGRRT